MKPELTLVEVGKDESPFVDLRNVRVLPMTFTREFAFDEKYWQVYFAKIEKQAEQAVNEFMNGNYQVFRSVKYNRSYYLKRPKTRIALYVVAIQSRKYGNVKYEMFYSPYEKLFWEMFPSDKNSEFASLYNATKFNIELLHSRIANRCIFDFSTKIAKVAN